MNTTFFSKDESDDSEFQLKEHTFVSSQFFCLIHFPNSIP